MRISPEIIFSFFILINIVYCKSVDHALAKAIEEVRPHKTIWWTNFDGRSARIYEHLTSYQLALKKLLSTTPTKQVNINTLQPFTEYPENWGILFNLELSAPMHFITIFADNKNVYIMQLKKVLKRIQSSIIYLSIPKYLVISYQTNNSNRQNLYFSIKNMFNLTNNSSDFVDFIILQVINPFT